MDGFQRLTKAEHKVIRAMLDGYWTNAQIAAYLIVSPRTVETHLRNVFVKTGARNRLELCLLYLTKNTYLSA